MKSELALVATALALGVPLLAGRVLAGHDIRLYLMYAAETAANLRAGALLPAWASELNGGYGGPGLFLYPPLTSLVHGLAAWAGLPSVVGISLLTVAATLLSGLATRAWLRAEGFAAGALPAAIFYMAAPYRTVTVYERSDLAEHWAFVFPPLILWAASTTLHAPRRIAILSAATAGLLLSNLPLAALFGLGLAAWFVGTAGPSGKRLIVALGAAAGYGLAAFALVPQALAERWVKTEIFWGGGLDAMLPSRNTLFGPAPQNPAFGTKISIVVLLTVALAAIAFLWARRTRGSAFWGALAVAAFLLTLSPFGRMWDRLPILSMNNFPWRLAAVVTLAGAALVGRISVPWQARLVAALAVLSSAPYWGRLLEPLSKVPVESPEAVPPGTRFPDPSVLGEASALAPNPWIRNPKLEDPGFIPRTLKRPVANEIFGDGPSVVGGRYLVSTSGVGVRTEVKSWSPLERTVRVSAAAPTTVVFHTLHFPGMRVTRSGQDLEVFPDPRTGLLACRIDAGDSMLTWRWEPFPELRLAHTVSAIFALLALALLVVPSRKPRADRV